MGGRATRLPTCNSPCSLIPSPCTPNAVGTPLVSLCTRASPLAKYLTNKGKNSSAPQYLPAPLRSLYTSSPVSPLPPPSALIHMINLVNVVSIIGQPATKLNLHLSPQPQSCQYQYQDRSLLPTFGPSQEEMQRMLVSSSRFKFITFTQIRLY